MRTLQKVRYAVVTNDYEKRQELYKAAQDSLQWVSTSIVSGGYRMKFGKFVEARKKKIGYPGSKDWWNSEEA